MNDGGRYGGDVGISGKGITINPRNLRRLAKKYPNDERIQKSIEDKLKEFTSNLNQDEKYQGDSYATD